MTASVRSSANPENVAALVAAASGASVAVLGGLVVAGWLTVAVTLIQVLPGMPPMQYNTALGFMICGAALLAATLDLRRPTALLGGLAAVIGLATLVETLFHSNLGIDDLLVEAYIFTGVSDPGRMAPNSALALGLSGLALLVLAWRPPSRSGHRLPALLGSIVVALGTAALVGYAADVPHAYGWGNFNRMALHSAVGFSLLGGGIVGLAWNKAQTESHETPDWLPGLSAIAVISVTAFLWYALTGGGGRESAVATITLYTGLLSALLLAWSLRAGQIAGRHARSLESANLTLHDEIDTRLRAEETMLQLAAIVESSNDAICGTTLDGLIQNWNHGAERLYGYSRHEVLGKHVSLIHAEQMKDADLLQRIAAGERVSRLETINLTKDGRKIEVSMTISPILDRTGQIVGASTIARDITDERVLDRLKSDFVGTVSHELRTPLSAIKGFLELVVDGEAGPINETQREFLDIAVRNSDRLGALINDLLDMSRIESDRLEMKSGPVDLGAVLAEVGATFRHEAYTKGLVLREEVPELPLIRGDKSRLIQVFCNLVSNAIKYTPKGEIGIRAAPVGDGVEVMVYDSGIGLTPEEQALLFTKFFRGSNPVVTESRGTGLGLVIAKAILQAHNASIDVESRPGEG
ncbi:MAG TPA: PAS domain S-box protein, partial [Gemmatimonadales bacterium]|nr:PAS domain S-box protein [Gemmatimonadales bacterium]